MHTVKLPGSETLVQHDSGFTTHLKLRQERRERGIYAHLTVGYVPMAARLGVTGLDSRKPLPSAILVIRE